MAKEIRHSGIVEAVESNRIRVRIAQLSACSACHAAERCAVAERRDKTVDVPRQGRHAPGDSVVVATAATTGFFAVAVAFVVPLVLMLIAASTSYLLTADEPLSALMAIAILVPYYAVVAAMRRRIARKVSFHIVE